MTESKTSAQIICLPNAAQRAERLLENDRNAVLVALDEVIAGLDRPGLPTDVERRLEPLRGICVVMRHTLGSVEFDAPHATTLLSTVCKSLSGVATALRALRR